MSLSCHNLVLFKSPKDSSQVNHLAKQMFPGLVKYMQETFQDATKQPYGDLKLETPNDLRLRSNVLPGEMQCAYVKNIGTQSVQELFFVIGAFVELFTVMILVSFLVAMYSKKETVHKMLNR